MSHKYIQGVKAMANYFRLPWTVMLALIQRGGIPGVRKIKRKAADGFPGGGRGVWVIEKTLAESYKHTRKKTPAYDPVRAVDALVNKFEGSGATNIPELIEMGLINDLDWCEELNRQRELSNLHVPILMHPQDLQEWFGRKIAFQAHELPETTNIFRQVRNR